MMLYKPFTLERVVGGSMVRAPLLYLQIYFKNFSFIGLSEHSTHLYCISARL